MDASAALWENFGRLPAIVHGAVDGLSEEQLAWRPDPDANSIAWLAWHLARAQDSQIAHVAEADQVWTAGSWAQRFGLPFEAAATGYGHDGDDVAAVRASADLLTGYLDAVQERTRAYVEGLSDTDLDQVVDATWDPPVTLGVRLASILGDDLQHAGQASYLRGLLDRR